ncbi:zinc-ribbon domain-containing protein [Streptococcus caviae]|uniref:zinc ribbon domain-containing protein n=1 Tax=Streptococcus sp. 'caviae' TaxID=1915004 RepID=UPI00094B8C41|nr:zinc ribbon domain-containing protein [Streptococcus sp. 'caviae']OLN84604.1 hypothetical protein BMI76_00560 [Streptococcus sp. 'caviae']
MFCSRCGKENKSGSKFCVSCGASLQTINTVSEMSSGSKQKQVNTKLGSSPDFYTYVTAGLLVIVLMLSMTQPVLGIFISFISIVTGLIGFKHATNRKLQFILLAFAIILLMICMSNHTDQLYDDLFTF